MKWLEKLGLAPKNKSTGSILGEKKEKGENGFSLHDNWYIKFAIILLFFAGLFVSIPGPTFKQELSYSVGEPWRKEDLTAPFTFALKKTEEDIQKEIEQIRRQTPPIFYVNQSARISTVSQLDSLYQQINQTLESHANRTLNDPSGVDNPVDSLKYANQKEELIQQLDKQSWETLSESFLQAVKKRGIDNAGQHYIGSEIRQQLLSIIDRLMSDGIINLDKQELDQKKITVRNQQNRTEKTYDLSNIRDLTEAKKFAKYRLSRTFFDDASRTAYQLFQTIISPNWNFDPQATDNQISEAISNISKTEGAVTEGQVIIRRGDIITQEKYNMLKSLAEARAQQATKYEIWLRYIGEVLVIIAVTMIFLMYLYLYRRTIFNNNAMFLLVFLAMGIIIAASAIIYHVESVPSYIVPVAIAPIILTIIFDSRVGLISTFTLALLTGIIHSNSFQYVVATTTACSLGLYTVRDIKDRSQFFFTTPGIVFLAYAVVLTGFNLSDFNEWSELGTELTFVGINAVFILFTYPLILLFEKLFNVTTDFTLLELSDTNLPLLKQLMTRAPGSFHHSLQVANLSEAAASAIGANALKCRVGALYHDIGKMEKPEYFTENQTSINAHDNLKPRMSALVIKAHVSDGVNLAREHDLPETIIDFIRTHHGTTLIKYFYDKAKKTSEKEKDHEIQEEDFQYEGPLPHSKETGILLLADCVEATSRAMKNPTYQKLDSMISRLFEDRINEGQLNNCPLTFRELTMIKESFLNILVGFYHTRVEYPEDKKNKEIPESEKGPEAEKNSDQDKKPAGVYKKGTDDESLPTPINS